MALMFCIIYIYICLYTHTVGYWPIVREYIGEMIQYGYQGFGRPLGATRYVLSDELLPSASNSLEIIGTIKLL